MKTSEWYRELKEGEVYDEDFTPLGSDFSVIQLVGDWPEDWEEVFDEPKKLHKDTDLGYFAGLAMIGYLANSNADVVRMDQEEIAEYCVNHAQALIEALDKEVGNG